MVYVEFALRVIEFVLDDPGRITGIGMHAFFKIFIQIFNSYGPCSSYGSGKTGYAKAALFFLPGTVCRILLFPH